MSRAAAEFGRWVARGDASRDSGNIAEAAKAYAAALAVDSTNGGIHVQLGNMLKDLRRYGEAERAYQEALACGADPADTWLQLGRARKLSGWREGAIQAFIQSMESAANPREVIDELVSVGKGWAVQQKMGLGASKLVDLLDGMEDVRSTLRRMEDLLPDIGSLTALPRARWDLWRKLWQPMSAPTVSNMRCAIVLDAVGSSLEAFKECAASIREASDYLTAVVVATDVPAIQLEAERLIAAGDTPHWRCVNPGKAAGLPTMLSLALAPIDIESLDGVLLLSEPLVLEREALPWLHAALARSAVIAAYTDEDHVDVLRWRAHDRYHHFSPVLKDAPDIELLNQGLDLGAMLLVRSYVLRTWLASNHDALPGSWLDLHRWLCAQGPVAHVSQVLAGRLTAPKPKLVPREAAVAATHEDRGRDGVIDVIIPTRDKHDLLRRCVATLYACASNPHSLNIIIVDNGSVEAETLSYLSQLRDCGQAAVLKLGGAFNWAALNNEAARMGRGRLLVFCNNDIEMLSSGWDVTLRTRFDDEGVGAVGARLLYPDHTIQHAGIVLGCGRGGTEHEGRNAGADDAGPSGRWMLRRSVGAVTGAFLATPRTVFEEEGGFDARRFSIWFNDVDYCLRLRSRGKRVVYEPAVEAVHHESKTLSETVDDRARTVNFETAATEMSRIWGEMFETDPYYNPHYARWGEPFEWLIAPRRDTTLASL
jgi:GT2 family glycosyltransferase/tetratricopeptide (TPR) repeat protein